VRVLHASLQRAVGDAPELPADMPQEPPTPSLTAARFVEASRRLEWRLIGNILTRQQRRAMR